MADGTTQPIEQVKTGDLVLAKDQYAQAHVDKDGKQAGVATKTVIRTLVHEHAPTLTLCFQNGEQITTTLGHPFFVEGKGWTLSGHLAIGNAIVTRAGPAVKISGIKPGSEATVYNFEVEQAHTYFVGNINGGLWVHNISIPEDLSPLDGGSLKAGQDIVSKQQIGHYIDKIQAGEPIEPISVEGDVIINGHHRYIAGQLTGTDIPTRPSGPSAPGIPPRQPVSWKDVYVDD